LTAVSTTAPAPALAAVSDGGANIIGGSDASQPYPFAARLLTVYPGLGTGRCTATVVTDHGRTGIVTAAHCVTDFATADAVAAGDVTVQVGSTRLDQLTNITPPRIEVHPGWSWGTGGGPIADLAVLVLPQGVHVRGIPLGGRAGVARGVRLLGWGKTTVDATQPPPVLQQLDTWTTDPSNCAAAGITAGELCIDAREGGSPCLGDSGGPALGRTAHTRWVLLGGASRGPADPATGEETCAGPTVYTDFTAYRGWIRTALAHRQPHHRRHVATGAADRFLNLR
jgi:secreted trypsin-like serine protease